MRSATDLARSIGTAKPTPTLPDSLPELEEPDPEMIESLMPMIRPIRSARAPPELPGLIGASVWIMATSPPGVWMARPTALTMPSVTVWSRP